MLVLGVFSELALWGENKINKVGEGRKKKRRRGKKFMAEKMEKGRLRYPCCVCACLGA